MNLVRPLEDFGSDLNKVQSPSRYTGGEYGVCIKKHTSSEKLYNFAVAFPDLYEIAMSNLAVRIIYNGLNAIENVRCERVFAPAQDFEQLLSEKNKPLYTLETGMPLNEVDMIGFSIGYELGITEVLAMLDSGRIPLKSRERTEKDPIVIAGGCGVTNPAPFCEFFDAIIVGEAEPVLFELVKELADSKEKGATRNELLEIIKSKPFIWTRNECSEEGGKTARRAVQNNFGLVPSVPSWFPLPTSKPVQDHGVIEIMRGCPNGCRFCHAGIYYRPMRVKNINLIIDEIDHLVFDAGYREISLNSLSSADFPNVSGLLDVLNERYKKFNVSFQLPSLKVNSISLGILEKLNQVRKSGLTFAVETPEEMWQLSLNKEVYAQHLESIIKEAKAKGWSSAKFYFMVGLPLGDYFESEKKEIGAEGTEEKAIVDFLIDLQARTRIQCNVNVGVFIPKPHTAYERMTQITPEKAREKIDYIYKNLPRGKFKLGKHNYDQTILEGLMSRGDERAADVILTAYKLGARFDAWDEHLRENIEFWNKAFDQADYDVKKWIYKDWTADEKLPWSGISLGVSPNFYKKEWDNSVEQKLTQKCASDCDHKCGICNQKENVRVYKPAEIESASSSIKNKTLVQPKDMPECNIPVVYRVIFNFERNNGAEWIAYLSQIEIFHKAILRSGIQFIFTTGFNPLPRLEFVSPMTLGLPSLEETASCYLYEDMDVAEFINTMNKSLPSNLHITSAKIFPVTNMRKREALSQGLWGGIYNYRFKCTDDMEIFFESEQYKSLSSKEGFRSEKVSSTEYIFTVPVSDKCIRTAFEEVTGKKWFDCITVTKTHTLAKPEVKGWTLEDENNWRYNNKNFKKAKSEDESKEPISFMALYDKIAKVNADLIEARKDMEKKRDEFYSEHPDVLLRHRNKG